MRRRLLSLVLAVAGLCVTAAPASAQCPGADSAPTASNLPAVKSATLCLLNDRRAQNGLSALGGDSMLEDAATRFSRRMVAEGFFSHEAPDGTDLVDRLRASGYLNGLSGWSVGENIAYGTGRYATPASIVQMWMDSSGHRANILSTRYRAIGIGIALGTPRSSSGATYTTDFGSTVRSAAPTAPTTSPPSSSPRPTRPPRRRKKAKRSKRSRRACHRSRRSRRAGKAPKRRCARRAHRRNWRARWR
jgi:uncharacterized protein YkwD